MRNSQWCLLGVSFIFLILYYLSYWQFIRFSSEVAIIGGFFVSFILIIVSVWEVYFEDLKPMQRKKISVFTTLLSFFIWLVILSVNFFEEKTNSEKAVDRLFEKIRDDNGALNIFLSNMPKGGDLHHHFSGSVYAENLWENLIISNAWINVDSLSYSFKEIKRPGWIRCSQLKKLGLSSSIKQKVIEEWSCKDFSAFRGPADKHFFNSFGKFNDALNYNIPKALEEIKQRAIEEHVSYIETMISTPDDSSISFKYSVSWQEEFLKFSVNKYGTRFHAFLKGIYDQLIADGILNVPASYLKSVHSMHDSFNLENDGVTLRYLMSVNRTNSPLQFFRKLVIAFNVANSDSLIVGVNILSREDNEVALRDYLMHMEMFKFCSQMFRNVKFSMHAGELVMGMVVPENLRFHIAKAIDIVEPNRIGHGVDIPLETEAPRILRKMAEKQIAIEINLTSNKFILGVSGPSHPIMLYHKFQVPIVISTDDAGILRSTLTNEYVLLASSYKKLKYSDIKKFVLNSIEFSFFKSYSKKQELYNNLEKSFKNFEKAMIDEFQKEYL